MKRSRLPGASRGLGRVKPHVERCNRGWVCFNIVSVPGAVMGGVLHEAEVMERVGWGKTWLEALHAWAPPILDYDPRKL